MPVLLAGKEFGKECLFDDGVGSKNIGYYQVSLGPRESGAAPTAGGARAIGETSKATAPRPHVLGIAFGDLARLAFGTGDCQTGDSHRVA